MNLVGITTIENLMRVAETKIQIVPQEEWNPHKEDPTEYSSDTNTIRVRNDYDAKSDPAGWIVHEQTHATMPSDESGSYPNNPVEEQAYKEQFRYLKSLGYNSVEEILEIPTLSHKKDYIELFKTWWDEI